MNGIVVVVVVRFDALRRTLRPARFFALCRNQAGLGGVGGDRPPSTRLRIMRTARRPDPYLQFGEPGDES